jgi:CelD/BcsL family acetyltransferase involved in cellulose biosynthesis
MDIGRYGDLVDLRFIHDEAEFVRLKREWNHLLSHSVVDVPFLRHEFQSTWWRTLGGGEWSQGELWIAAGRGEAGELLGLAPCFRNVSEPENPKIMLMGSKEIADYLDLIVSPTYLTLFSQKLIEELQAFPESIWKQVDLYNVPEWSPTVETIVEIARDHGLRVESERLQPCPWMKLEGDWGTYLSRLNKKQRHELRRKFRRAESFEGGIRFRLLSRHEELKTGIGAFLDLMSFDPQKVTFLNRKMRSTISEMIAQAFENGWLILAFLETNDEVIAGYLNFDYNGQIWIYNSGIHPDYRDLSPGWVLLGHIIQWAIENGRRGIDFLRGDESYKYQLGGHDRYIRHIVLSR